MGTGYGTTIKCWGITLPRISIPGGYSQLLNSTKTVISSHYMELTVANSHYQPNSHYQLSWWNQIILLYFPPTQHHSFVRNLPLYPTIWTTWWHRLTGNFILREPQWNVVIHNVIIVLPLFWRVFSRDRSVSYLQVYPRSWTQGSWRQNQLVVRTGLEPATYRFQGRLSNHSATLPPQISWDETTNVKQNHK